ncbi:MAG TPA: transposase [Pirellulales bacterium]|jgi:REP element-mobilizing transposase RayT|nr:transposase [Pirellulales bacterium]
MASTLGYHVVVSGYGLWLPGDVRGHWSEAWDEQIGFTEPHALHAGDPVRLRMARQRMKHPPVRLDAEMAAAVVEAIGGCAAESDWTIEAAAVEATHTHLLLTYSTREIAPTIKWLKDRTTKAVHAKTAHRGPVWCKGHWCSFVFEQSAWKNIRSYIERHNLRRDLGPRPYDFQK